jgi:DNA gyrase subunit B
VSRWSTPSQAGWRSPSTGAGKVHYQDYKIGVPQKPVEVIGETDRNGTTVRFHPDTDIFEETVFSFDVLSKRLRELAFLNKGIKILLTDQRGEQDKYHEFVFEGGVKSFVEYLNKE